MKRKPVKEIYTLEDLRNFPDNTPAMRLGVFGDPVGHSLSPEMQNAALRHAKLDLQYARFQISPDQLHEALRLIRDLDFIGLNLTVPHKIQALTLVDDVDEEAKRIGAVNTVAVRNGKLIGFNTDGRGFSRAVREEFSVDLRDLRVMVLGAGGAARAIALQCAKEKCERLVIVNRTLAAAKNVTDELHDFFAGPRVLGPVPRLQAVAWEESAIGFQVGNVDLIVNATPIGLQSADRSPIPARLLAPHLMIYDTVYSGSQGRTPFVIAAIEAGARATNGLSMLLHQGARSFELWFGLEAPIDVMRQALR
jgi:shikimate dehydrogenase